MLLLTIIEHFVKLDNTIKVFKTFIIIGALMCKRFWLTTQKV